MRAASCPFRPFVTTLPVITGCPSSVTPGEAVRSVAWLVGSGLWVVHSAPGAAAPATFDASVLLAPFDVILSFRAAPKRSVPRASLLNVGAVKGPPPAGFEAGQTIV